jgi:hypothetical protein
MYVPYFLEAQSTIQSKSMAWHTRCRAGLYIRTVSCGLPWSKIDFGKSARFRPDHSSSGGTVNVLVMTKSAVHTPMVHFVVNAITEPPGGWLFDRPWLVHHLMAIHAEEVLVSIPLVQVNIL